MTKLHGWNRLCIVLVLSAIPATLLKAQTYKVLASFSGNNGANPNVGSMLIQGMDGNFYGTASAGGDPSGDGVFFRLTASGTITSLHSFQGTDGRTPTGLLLLLDGNIYGLTQAGGRFHNCGTIFQWTPQQSFNSLFNFHGGPDPCSGYADLALGVNGNAYGVSSAGGASNLGTIYEAIPNTRVQPLHSFDGSDGRYPWAGLTLATDGNFFGVTPTGGTNNNCSNSCGTIFKIAPGGKFTTIHDFDGTDGSGAYASLIQGLDGDFYGTTAYAGSREYGSVYKVTVGGRVTPLHNFNGTDGNYPFTSLIQATDGNFYGTTSQGGPKDAGTIFRITPQGVFTTLYTFCSEQNCNDGADPLSGLLQSTSGLIYGMAKDSGPGGNDNGVIFTLDLGLGPFAAFVNRFGSVGETIGILGQGFTGTTSVQLNGVPADFNVMSDTYLTATIPSGASTGYVTVTTTSGVLKSNVPFEVIQ